MIHRNSSFGSRQPLSSSKSLESAPTHVNGPFNFLNPTRAHYHHASSPSDHHVSFAWSSRDNRKGRHALQLSTSAADDPSISTPQRGSHPQEIAKGIVRMFTVYPIWDVSYLVATIFTLGSVVWVFNAFFVFLPTLEPSTEFDTEILYGGGITAFVGATIFEIGSVILMLEAINEKREGCFGWAVEAWLHGGDKEKQATASIHPHGCVHHHANKKNLVGKPVRAENVKPVAVTSSDNSWTWWPTMHDLRTHYLHELGFLACASQMIGATIFWIAGFTALPGINNVMSQGLLDGVYWTPQVVGGFGFIVSGTLFMIETQKAWYIPAFGVLGWWIGFFNLIGGVGFTLSPCFGYDTHSWAQYQAGCSTFWASWAFLIGSVVQWYESLDKYPVTIVKR